MELIYRVSEKELGRNKIAIISATHFPNFNILESFEILMISAIQISPWKSDLTNCKLRLMNSKKFFPVEKYSFWLNIEVVGPTFKTYFLALVISDLSMHLKCI